MARRCASSRIPLRFLEFGVGAVGRDLVHEFLVVAFRDAAWSEGNSGPLSHLVQSTVHANSCQIRNGNVLGELEDRLRNRGERGVRWHHRLAKGFFQFLVPGQTEFGVFYIVLGSQYAEPRFY